MRIATFSRAREIPPELWDAAVPEDFFFQRSFLAAMEEGGVEGARYRYLALFGDGSGNGAPPIGLAVLSAFTLRLDLLSGDPWIRLLRRISGGFLDIPIICCGIPASFGQHHLHVRAPGAATRAVELVHRSMEAWAEEEGIGLLFWKEWHPGQPEYRAILGEGFIGLPTLPDHRLSLEHIRPPCRPFDPPRTGAPGSTRYFLRALRAPYRRKFRSAEALLRGGGPPWSEGPLELHEVPFTSEHVSRFYDGYRHVMERTPVRLETYPEAFFHALARSDLDVRLLQLSLRDGSESVSALLVADRTVLTFILTGKEQARHRMPLYPLLLRCIVLLAVRRRFSEVRLGQTSSYSKGSVGAGAWRLETLVRARQPLRHRILEVLGARFFPEVRTPTFHVFREGVAPARERPPYPKPSGIGS
jgi:hypothetical protein